ncbi:hypothetical protein, partial [Streptomyces sp. NPDC059900]
MRRDAAFARELLHLLDHGTARSVTERAVLLAGAANGEGGESAAGLPLGMRDRCILRLHTALFGTTVEARGTCPHCLEATVLALTSDQLHGIAPTSAEPIRVALDGYTVTCRLLTSVDLGRAARTDNHAQARASLLTASVVHAEQDGMPVTAMALPPHVVEALAETLAEADPFAEIRLRMICETCDGTWDAVLDLPQYVWHELLDWGHALMW